jgi:hypothetical protein
MTFEGYGFCDLGKEIFWRDCHAMAKGHTRFCDLCIPLDRLTLTEALELDHPDREHHGEWAYRTAVRDAWRNKDLTRDQLFLILDTSHAPYCHGPEDSITWFLDGKVHRICFSDWEEGDAHCQEVWVTADPSAADLAAHRRLFRPRRKPTQLNKIAAMAALHEQQAPNQ